MRYEVVAVSPTMPRGTVFFVNAGGDREKALAKARTELGSRIAKDPMYQKHVPWRISEVEPA